LFVEFTRVASESPGYGYLFFGYAPGPDLACQDAVRESEAFISSQTVGYPHPVAPGQAGL
jgi:hypothetical protein